jgi:hypothetical protein
MTSRPSSGSGITWPGSAAPGREPEERRFGTQPAVRTVARRAHEQAVERGVGSHRKSCGNEAEVIVELAHAMLNFFFQVRGRASRIRA